MKAVIRNYDDAISFIHRVFDKLGEEFQKPQLIECKDYHPPRTLDQNRRLHWMIGLLASHIGYSPSELKDWFKIEYGPKKKFVYGNYAAMIPKSTAEYSKMEMIEFIGQIDRVAAELGFQFPENEDGA